MLVACSGGPDSLALAAATGFVAPRLGWRAGAVVVDHGLQDESAQVAARAADQCRDLGLAPVLVRSVEVGGDGGPEAAARTARYAALDSAAAALDATVVLLGHTLDDQAEQVLLALARGSGPRSLAGMPARRGIYRRPFLDLRRATTTAACDAQGLAPWHDPTNSTGTGRRTRVRTEVMPLLTDVLGPGVTLALARTADLLRDTAEALDHAAAALLAGTDGAVPVETLAEAPAAVRRAALRAMAVEAGSPAGSLGVQHVAAVEALVLDWHGQGPVHLPGAVLARRDCGRLRVGPSATSTGPASSGRTGPAPTDGEGTPVDAADVGDDLEQVLLTEDQLHQRLDEMAAEIDADYAGDGLLLVGVLKGAVMVMADLARRLHLPVHMDWMAVSSYGSGTKSSGVVRILKDLDTDLTGQHVLIVEDVVDSGLTLSWLLANLRSRGPASVAVAALLRKPDAAKVDLDVRYVGFDIPNDFVVGYGLDYDQRYRNLPFVATLAPHVYTSRRP